MMQATKDVLRFIRGTNDLRGIRGMVALARSEPGIAISPNELDQDAFLLNVKNGTIDLRTGQLRPHAKSDFCTKLAPIEYDPHAVCPRWLEFLATVFADDQELIGFVKRLMGYCLTGDIREQILVILHGGGANGKSTLFNALLDICGDYAIKTTESLLLEKGNSEHPTIFADLEGRRVAIASETSAGARLAEARIKDLTGGERIRARKMRADFSEFIPTHKILLATNHPPRIKGTDNAIWRRIRLVPFDVTIAPADQDKDLAAKLRAEYPGILAWMVAGCLEWQRDGLGMPARVEAATDAYRTEENAVGTFVAMCCEVAENATVGATELLHAFYQFTGDRSISQKMLAILLTRQGFENARATRGPHKGRVVWHGLRLLAE